MRRALLCGCVVLLGCLWLSCRKGSPEPEQPSGPAALEDREPASRPEPPAGTEGSRKPAAKFDVPDETSAEGEYKITIVREYGNPQEAKLIQLAESTYPGRDDVLAAAQSAWVRKAVLPAEQLWWYDSFDDVRIPYAVTGDALRYYRDLTLAFRGGDFSGSNNIPMLNSNLDYKATVKHHESYTAGGKAFQDVTLVSLTLTWGQYCGSECAMYFKKEREVVFDRSGKILAVLFDGKTGVLVS